MNWLTETLEAINVFEVIVFIGVLSPLIILLLVWVVVELRSRCRELESSLISTLDANSRLLRKERGRAKKEGFDDARNIN